MDFSKDLNQCKMEHCKTGFGGNEKFLLKFPQLVLFLKLACVEYAPFLWDVYIRQLHF